MFIAIQNVLYLALSLYAFEFPSVFEKNIFFFF